MGPCGSPAAAENAVATQKHSMGSVLYFFILTAPAFMVNSKETRLKRFE
jgi:hypothetical protein